MKRLLTTTLGALALTVGVSTAEAKETKYQVAGAVNANGITVTAREGNVHDGEKLWLKLLFVNNSGKTVLLDRNQVQVKAPGGGVFTRITPVTGKGDVFIVKHNDKQNLYVEFAAPINTPVTVELKGAYALDLQPIVLPPMQLTPGG